MIGARVAGPEHRLDRSPVSLAVRFKTARPGQHVTSPPHREQDIERIGELVVARRVLRPRADVL